MSWRWWFWYPLAVTLIAIHFNSWAIFFGVWIIICCIDYTVRNPDE